MATDPADRPTYELDTLYPGCQIWTPLQRWETIIKIDDIDGYRRRVTTEKCAVGYGWTFPKWRKFEAIIPRGERYVPDPEIRLVDLGRATTPRVLLVPTAAHIEIPDFGVAIAEATYVGRNQGWDVTDRTGTGELTTTPYISKAAARTALRAVGRTHARALGVRYCEQDGHHTHQQETHR